MERLSDDELHAVRDVGLPGESSLEDDELVTSLARELLDLRAKSAHKDRIISILVRQMRAESLIVWANEVEKEARAAGVNLQ